MVFTDTGRCIGHIIENLGQNPGIGCNDIIIILLEPEMENWGSKGDSQPVTWLLDLK